MTTRPLTTLMLNALMAASRSAAGVRVQDLVTATMLHDRRSLNAARSRVSCTIRALETRGLVELHERGSTPGSSELRKRWRDFLAWAAANPEACYAMAVKIRGNDPWHSASACVAAKALAAENTPRMYATRITITPMGFARLKAALDAAAGA